jgi:hypothetical protein
VDTVPRAFPGPTILAYFPIIWYRREHGKPRLSRFAVRLVTGRAADPSAEDQHDHRPSVGHAHASRQDGARSQPRTDAAAHGRGTNPKRAQRLGVGPLASQPSGPDATLPTAARLRLARAKRTRESSPKQWFGLRVCVDQRQLASAGTRPRSKAAQIGCMPVTAEGRPRCARCLRATPNAVGGL